MTQSTLLPTSSEENRPVIPALTEEIAVPPLPQVATLPVEQPSIVLTDLPNAVGARLRVLREQKKLSLQFIADRLNLNLKTIQHLEADEYNKLPPTTFVRGYICSYAKLLETDAAPLVELYKHSCDKATPPLLPQFKEKPQANTGDPWFKILTAVIVVALMLLMALWRPDNLINKGANVAPAPTNLPEINRNGQDQNLSLPPPAATPPATSQAAPANPASPTNPTNPANPAPSPAAPANTAATPVPPAGEKPADPNQAKPNEAVVVKDPKVLILHFKEDSWSEIIDARGKKVYSNVGKGGTDVTVNGNPPFKVRVGTVGGIIAEYKGEKIDMTPQPNKSRKYTVGVALPHSNDDEDEE